MAIIKALVEIEYETYPEDGESRIETAAEALTAIKNHLEDFSLQYDEETIKILEEKTTFDASQKEEPDDDYED